MEVQITCFDFRNGTDALGTFIGPIFNNQFFKHNYISLNIFNSPCLFSVLLIYMGILIKKLQKDIFDCGQTTGLVKNWPCF